MSASPRFPKLPQHWIEEQYNLDHGVFFRLWSHIKKREAPQKILVIVHGQGEQSDRYEHFTHYLDVSVDMIAAIDLPGHGKSEGPRGHIDSYSQYHQALESLVQRLLQEFGPSPDYYLFGHSMGGQVALGYLSNISTKAIFKKTIICAPLLDLGFPPPAVKVWMAKLAVSILPKLKIPSELNLNHLTHDPEVNQYYNENPLNHGYVTPKWFTEMRKEGQRLRALSSLPTPSLWIIPMDDQIVSAPASYQLAQQLKKKCEVQLETFPGFYHEAFNEVGKERVFNLLNQYLAN